MDEAVSQGFMFFYICPYTTWDKLDIIIKNDQLNPNSFKQLWLSLICNTNEQLTQLSSCMLNKVAKPHSVVLQVNVILMKSLG